MLNYLIRLIICAVFVYFSPQYLSDIHVEGATAALFAALLMSILNTFVKPILSILAFPITVLTLGLFSLVINIAIVYLCAYLVDGFSVEGIFQPLLFGIALSVLNSIVGFFQD